MSDPLGRHYCQDAQDLDDFGWAYCPHLKKRTKCLGLDDFCEVELWQRCNKESNIKRIIRFLKKLFIDKISLLEVYNLKWDRK